MSPVASVRLSLSAVLSTCAVLASDVAVFTHPAGDRYDGPWIVEVAARDAVSCRVLDAQGDLVAGPFAGKTFSVPAESLRLWSAEDPAWYVLAAEGETRRIEVPFAFCERTIRGDRLFINGRPVRLKLGPKAWHGNTVSAHDCTREEALTNGLYRLPLVQLSRLRVQKPALTAGGTRHRFQNWSVTATNYCQRLVVENRNAFRDASDVTLRWTLLRDGRPGKKGTIDLYNLRPGQSAVFDMPPEVIAARYGEGTFSVRFSFLRDGETIAEDQVDLVASREPEVFDGSVQRGWFDWFVPTVDYKETACEKRGFIRRFTTPKSDFTFTAERIGAITYARRGWFSDTPLVSRILPVRQSSMDEPSLDFVGPTTSVSERGGCLSLTEEGLSEGIYYLRRWRICPDGTVACVARLRTSAAQPGERLGFVLFLDQPVKRLAWFGRGPWSHGPGETEGAFLGRWETEPGASFAAEDVRGLRAGDLTIRTLGAPLAIDLTDGLLTLTGDPGPDGTVELAFTLSVDDDELTARMRPGDMDLPAEFTFDITSQENGHLVRLEQENGHPARLEQEHGHLVRLEQEHGHPARLEQEHESK